MLELIVGIWIVVSEVPSYSEKEINPDWGKLLAVVTTGGKFQHSIELQTNQPFRVAEFLRVDNLAECIVPENVHVWNAFGLPARFRVVDEKLPSGLRRWSIRPFKKKFRRVVGILDIDFVNKCTPA